jgi:hypothetical protein
MSGVLQTYNNLLQSNVLFSYTIANGDDFNLDLGLEIELLILYLKINSSNTHLLALEEHKVIEEIFSGHFVIDRNKVITPTRTITTKELRGIMLKMEHDRYVYSKKIIPLKPVQRSPKETTITPIRPGSIIKFPIQQTDIKKMVIDGKKEFQTTMELNDDTREYVRTVETQYNEKMTRIILNILTGRFSKLEQLDKILLQGHLNIFPILYSTQNGLKFVDGLELPQSNIGVSRMEYTDEEVKTKDKRIKEILWRIERIDYQLNNRGPHLSAGRIFELENIQKTLQSEYVEEQFAYYTLTQSPRIYNHNLIENIDQAIYENHIELNLKYNDPIITFFAIDYQEGKASFHCSTHLSTFQNLIAAESIKETNKLTK